MENNKYDEILAQICGIDRKIIPSHLYKYYEINEYNIDALKSGYLFLSEVENFNDPYEGALILKDQHKETQNFIQQFDKIIKILEKAQIEKKGIPEKVKEAIKHYQWCKDNIAEEIVKGNKAFFDLYREAISNWRVGCLCENMNSMLMWSHYAQSHKGFCVEYDFEDVQNIYPVLYSDKVPSLEYINDKLDEINCGSMKRDFDLIANIAIYIKSKEWEYEKEWRVVLENSSKLSMRAKAVYLGSKCNGTEIQDICKDKGIPVKKMKINYNTYGLEVE